MTDMIKFSQDAIFGRDQGHLSHTDNLLISELINLLNVYKDKYGNKPVLFFDDLSKMYQRFTYRHIEIDSDFNDISKVRLVITGVTNPIYEDFNYVHVQQ